MAYKYKVNAVVVVDGIKYRPGDTVLFEKEVKPSKIFSPIGEQSNKPAEKPEGEPEGGQGEKDDGVVEITKERLKEEGEENVKEMLEKFELSELLSVANKIGIKNIHPQTKKAKLIARIMNFVFGE